VSRPLPVALTRTQLLAIANGQAVRVRRDDDRDIAIGLAEDFVEADDSLTVIEKDGQAVVLRRTD
jgi:hypothetical protein